MATIRELLESKQNSVTQEAAQKLAQLHGEAAKAAQLRIAKEREMVFKPIPHGSKALLEASSAFIRSQNRPYKTGSYTAIEAYVRHVCSNYDAVLLEMQQYGYVHREEEPYRIWRNRIDAQIKFRLTNHKVKWNLSG